MGEEEMIKEWLIKVGIKKMGPSAIRAAIAALVGIMAAHAGLLSELGIVSDKALNTITIDLNKLTAWFSVTGIGIITAALAAAQHHGEQIVAKKEEIKSEEKPNV
jgi:xanthine/uracil/vitamin C permease (AzgA family)